MTAGVLIGLLIGVILTMEAVAWLLRFTVMVNVFPGTQHPEQFSILVPLQQHIEHIHSAQC
jgi:hypothetical protein